MEENQEQPKEESNTEPTLQVKTLEAPKEFVKPNRSKMPLISIILMVVFILLLGYVAYLVSTDHCGMCEMTSDKRCVTAIDYEDILAGTPHFQEEALEDVTVLVE